MKTYVHGLWVGSYIVFCAKSYLRGGFAGATKLASNVGLPESARARKVQAEKLLSYALRYHAPARKSNPPSEI